MQFGAWGMAGEKEKIDNPSRAKRKRERPQDEAETVEKAKPSTGQAGDGKPVEPETTAAEPEQAEKHERAPCPVAGVGASAGGLEALQGLFTHVPTDLKVAFVVVQHRAVDRTSVMRSLIEKHTQLTVKDIEDGMKIEPATIYLGPADKDVSVLNGVLFLVEAPPHVGVHLPIDSFFRSLAQNEADRAIGIVLSGTGSDGTLGLKEIKAAGGLLMAQEETQAKYDSMPRSAIDTGLVDFVLPVEKMGEQLAQYLRHPLPAKPKPADVEEKQLDSLFQKIFILIRAETGHDFSHYKRNTIQRRIARRLAVHQIEHLDQYVRFLQENREEVKTLAKELLITVTNFFRDHEAFEKLQEQAIAPLVVQKAPDSFIRIWVAGCATGEEAYSIAMMLYEEIARSEKHFAIQIFATDIDEESIETARQGQYPKSIEGDVSRARLKRFFAEENNQYKVKSMIREMVVFAKHNLTKDSPFSKLDLVCCRNVLIYMDAILQKKLIPMFHYTLNPGGFLFLGESESVGSFSDLFVSVDARHKLFRRKPVTTGYEPDTEVGYYPQVEPVQKGKGQAKKQQQAIGEIAERMVLRDYSMPCVLVDDDYNIVYFNGDVNKYLIQPGGKPTFNILHMVRPEIHYKLNLLLKHVFHERRMAVEKDVRVRVNDHHVDVDIIVRPINEPGVRENLLLVIFQVKKKEKKPGEEGETSPVNLPEQEKDSRIRELEQELQSAKEYLQTTIEELETSNEELKSSNEELQSTNEELQSTNEELDTSREELQSTNEELRTVNSEYQQKISELSKGYDDLSNLMMTAEVATLFLDRALKIRQFTPVARKMFRLIERDVGRPLASIVTNLKYEGLMEDIRTVLETLTRIKKEVRGEGDRYYQMRIVPYRTAENVIDGAVVTFVDITEYKNAMLASTQVGNFVEAIVETVRQPLLILDKDLKVIRANPAFYRHFQVSPDETVGRLVFNLGDRQWNIPALRELLEQIVPQNTKFEGFKVSHNFPRIGNRVFLLNALQTTLKGETTGRILLAFEDITGQQEGK
jgi:two-component system CheB/CheR fusion protein